MQDTAVGCSSIFLKRTAIMNANININININAIFSELFQIERYQEERCSTTGGGYRKRLPDVYERRQLRKVPLSFERSISNLDRTFDQLSPKI